MNNKGSDQTAQMCRLIFAFVVRKPPKTAFLTTQLIWRLKCQEFCKMNQCYRIAFTANMCRRAKIFYLSQPGIEPRSLDLQANTLPRRCKSRLLPQGSRSVLYIPRPCDIHPLQFEIRPRISWYRNHVKMNPREIFMHTTVIGWVIYGGRIVVERKYFTCPSRESNPGRWIYRQTLYHVAVKARFYRKAVEVYYIYLDPVTHVQSMDADEGSDQIRPLALLD